MRKQVTFSRKFPAKHPRAGEPTQFMEKIICGLPDEVANSVEFEQAMIALRMDPGFHVESFKYHTIRAGKNWKVGDILIPCIWEFDGGRFTKGNEKIQFAPELEIVKVWDIDIAHRKVRVEGKEMTETMVLVNNRRNIFIDDIAKNDGLTSFDFCSWFFAINKNNFCGQIICWNKDVEY